MTRRVLYDGTILKADPATFRHLGGMYACDATRVWFVGLEVERLDPATTFALAGDHATDGTRVVFRQHVIEAHAPSFEVLGMVGHFAITRDRDRLYALASPLENSPDATTFELLGAGLAADRSGLWRFAELREHERIEGNRARLRILDQDHACDGEHAWYRGAPIEGADASNFRALGHDLSTDGARFYRRGKVLDPAPTAVLGGGFMVVNGNVWQWGCLDEADAATFEPLDHLFARDAERVFFDGYVVEGADPSTFTLLAMGESRGWARDRAHVWFREYQSGDYVDGESLTRLEGVDAATFRALDDGLGCDADHVWRGVVPVAGADAASVRVLGHGWTRDATSLWLGDRRITGAHPDTLAIHGPYALLDLDEPDLEVIGDGFARSGDGVLFAGYTIEGPAPDARSLGGGYLVDADGAWHYELVTESRKMPDFVPGGGRLDGADPTTLRRDRRFAIDRESVYAGCTRLLDVDPSTFRALDAYHGTDGKVAYCGAMRIACRVDQLRTLGGKFDTRGSSVATLGEIDDVWATDGTTLFVEGRPVWDTTARYLSDDAQLLLHRLDVARFSLLDPWWGTDGQLVLDLRSGTVEVAAHTPSFEALGHGYGRDISNVWARSTRLADADPATFRVLADGYAVDGRGAWFRGLPIAGSRDLRALGGCWARDASGILCGNSRVDADPDTFVVVGAATAAEADWDGSRLAIDDPLWLGERVAVGRDRDRLWWGSYSGTTPIGVAIGHGYVVDDTQVWHAGTEVDADGTTFVAIGGGYARDAFRAYFHDRVTR